MNKNIKMDELIELVEQIDIIKNISLDDKKVEIKLDRYFEDHKYETIIDALSDNYYGDVEIKRHFKIERLATQQEIDDKLFQGHNDDEKPIIVKDAIKSNYKLYNEILAIVNFVKETDQSPLKRICKTINDSHFKKNNLEKSMNQVLKRQLENINDDEKVDITAFIGNGQ